MCDNLHIKPYYDIWLLLELPLILDPSAVNFFFLSYTQALLLLQLFYKLFYKAQSMKAQCGAVKIILKQK